MCFVGYVVELTGMLDRFLNHMEHLDSYNAGMALWCPLFLQPFSRFMQPGNGSDVDDDGEFVCRVYF